jgi:hypothetical protein
MAESSELSRARPLADSELQEKIFNLLGQAAALKQVAFLEVTH